MSFARNTRTDRRRRVMRETAAADSELAVESVRARKRFRSAQRSEDDDATIPIRRDPGYSQSVRRACQQRLVQLIPVRRSSLTIALLSLWSVWALLILAHYGIHVRGAVVIGGGNLQNTASQPPLPISYLLHLRSSHGIAHWLGGQLWMFTALASLMIFQLKRHKLDDYRAKYRVWILLSIAALVSSLDASTSGLLLLGKSIDAWALREVGYSGWSVVLATFASLVGVLGLRLCSELKSAPSSLIFWLGGLVAWAVSALVGTGLLKTNWSQSQTDMIVGGVWLGGILAVFVASGIYLRHIYIDAQRRFVMRYGMIGKKRKWKLPQWKLRRRTQATDDAIAGDAPADGKRIRKVAIRSDEDENFSNDKGNKNENIERTEKRPIAVPVESKRSWKLPKLRLPRWKSDPKLGPDYSDVDADQRMRDQGFTEPMAKKPGWFSKQKPATKIEVAQPNKTASTKPIEPVKTNFANNRDVPSDAPDFQEIGSERKRWWPTLRKTKGDQVVKPKTTPVAKSNDSTPKPVKVKKGWGLLKPKTASTPVAAKPQVNSDTAKPPKKRGNWFGMLDGLKLKPPGGSSNTSGPKKPIAIDNSKPIGPSSSVAARNDQARPPLASQTARNQSYNEDDDEDDSSSDRTSMSRAERKRLRKQQQENRRAA